MKGGSEFAKGRERDVEGSVNLSRGWLGFESTWICCCTRDLSLASPWSNCKNQTYHGLLASRVTRSGPVRRNPSNTKLAGSGCNAFRRVTVRRSRG